MTIKNVIGFGLFASIFLLISCSTINTRLGQFTAASSFNVRNLEYSTSSQTKTAVSGKSCLQTSFLGISGATDDRLQRAMDNAIKNGQEDGIDGDLLVNVRIENEIKNQFFSGSDCMVVTGDLVKIIK